MKRALAILTFLVFYVVGPQTFAQIAFGNSQQVTFDNALVDAADRGDTYAVTSLVKGGEYIDSRGKFDVTPLMRAVYRGHKEVVEYLLSAGADPNLTDIGGAAPLHIAARQGYVEVAGLLLKYGAAVDAVDDEGWSPLMRASAAKYSAVSDLLISKGADVNLANDMGETAVMYAVTNEDTKTLESLLRAGADTRKADAEGMNALELASRKRNEDVRHLVFEGVTQAPAVLAEAPVPVAPPMPRDTVKPAANPRVGQPLAETGNAQAGGMAMAHITPSRPGIAEAYALPWTGGAAKEEAPSQQQALAEIEREMAAFGGSPQAGTPKHAKENAAPVSTFKMPPSELPAAVSAVPVEKVEQSTVVASGAPLPWGASKQAAKPEEFEMAQADSVGAQPALPPIEALPEIQAAPVESRNPASVEEFAAPPPPALPKAAKVEEKPLAKKKTNSTAEDIIPWIIKEPEQAVTSPPAPKAAPAPEPVSAPVEEAKPVVEEKPVLAEAKRAEPAPIVPLPETAVAPQADAPAALPWRGAEASMAAELPPVPAVPERQVAVVPPAPPAMPSFADDPQPMPWQRPQAELPPAPLVPEPSISVAARVEDVMPLPPAPPVPYPLPVRAAPLAPMPVPMPAATALSAPVQPTPLALPPAPEPSVEVANAPEVKVSEAIRVPLSLDDEPQAAPVRPRPAFSTRTPARVYPSRAAQGKTVWVQVEQFPSEYDAIQYWHTLRGMYANHLDTLRVRVVRPVQLMSGREKVYLRIGPVRDEGDAASLCSVINAKGLRCSAMADMGAKGQARRESAGRTSGHYPPSYYGKTPRPSLSPYRQPGATASGYWVQLGTFYSRPQADAYWGKLQSEHSDIVGRMKSSFSLPRYSSSVGAETLRLRTGPFVHRAAAASLCDKLHSRQVSCIVVSE